MQASEYQELQQALDVVKAQDFHLGNALGLLVDHLVKLSPVEEESAVEEPAPAPPSEAAAPEVPVEAEAPQPVVEEPVVEPQAPPESEGI